MPMPMSGLSAAATDLGMALGQQTADETEEQRKRRLQQQQMQRMGLPAGGAANALGLGGMGVRTGY